MKPVGGKNMKYNKPEALVVIAAAKAIEHSAVNKGTGTFFDSSQQMWIDTVNAYEADE